MIQLDLVFYIFVYRSSNGTFQRKRDLFDLDTQFFTFFHIFLDRTNWDKKTRKFPKNFNFTFGSFSGICSIIVFLEFRENFCYPKF